MQSGIFSREKLVSNILLIVLVAGNLYLSIQYIFSSKQDQTQKIQTIQEQQIEAVQATSFLKLFIEKVLSTKGTVAYDDRVELESLVRHIKDGKILQLWNSFVGSKNSTDAQGNAINLMAAVVAKIQSVQSQSVQTVVAD